jgi:hypothetical protein
MFKNKIAPRSDIDNILLWHRYRMEILNEIRYYGKIQNPYTYGTSKKIIRVIVIGACAVTCCSPCIVWDSICCSLSYCMKNNSCKWGYGYKIIGESCKDTFEGKRTTDLLEIPTYKINKTIFNNVMLDYLKAFNECLALGTVNGAKKANIIRGEMFKMYSNFMTINLQDDGRIETIQRFIDQ